MGTMDTPSTARARRLRYPETFNQPRNIRTRTRKHRVVRHPQSKRARALTPYKVDPSKCFLGVYDATGLMKGFGSPLLQSSFDEYNTRPTTKSILPCMACQKVCPYGREIRGLI